MLSTALPPGSIVRSRNADCSALSRSHNRFRLIVLGRNADCSALSRSRNHFLLIVLSRKADCSALSRSRNRFRLIVRSRKADCSALRAPAITGDTRNSPRSRWSRGFIASISLPAICQKHLASKLADVSDIWQGFPVTLYQPFRISAIFLGLVIQI